MESLRLDNMERKLDTIMSRLEDLIRLEQKHESTVDRLDRMEKKLERLDDEVTSNTFITGVTERLGWIIVSAVVGVIAFFARGIGS